jgi:hypothetical protein
MDPLQLPDLLPFRSAQPQAQRHELLIGYLRLCHRYVFLANLVRSGIEATGALARDDLELIGVRANPPANFAMAFAHGLPPPRLNHAADAGPNHPGCEDEKGQLRPVQTACWIL